jgi:membrane protease YdiL (CAAX protease family)
MLYALPQAGSGSWLLMAVALGCGALWTLQREWTHGLLVPTITHLGWSLCLFVLVPLEEGAPV